MSDEYKGYVEMTDDEIGIMIDAIDAQINRLNNLKKRLEASLSTASHDNNATVESLIMDELQEYKKKYSEYEKELKDIFTNKLGIEYDLSDPTFFSKETLDRVINYLTGPSAEHNILSVKARLKVSKNIYIMLYKSVVYGIISDIMRGIA